MKKYLLVLILPFLWAGFSLAADIQQAEEQYLQGHFAAALSSYEELLRAYPNDPYLYYNIGNCYFKMGSKGLAVANYYRAFRLAPRDGDIRHNLGLALRESGERLVPSGMPEILHKAFFGLTLAELKGLFFIIWWLCCLVSVCWLIKRRGSWIVIPLWLAVLIVGGWYMWRVKIAAEPLAVVAVPVAELRSGPGTNFPASANIAQGHLVVLQDSRNDWKEVVVKSQGIKGWIETHALEQI